MNTVIDKHTNQRLNTRGKRPLRNLTPKDKVRVIQRIRNGETKASVSRDIGVPESTLRGWCKNEKKLRLMCDQMSQKFVLGNFQPAEKKNKLDSKNPFTLTTQCLDGVPCFKNFVEYSGVPYSKSLDFIINDNKKCDQVILEEITITELMKRTSLPISEAGIKQFSEPSPYSSNRTFSPNYNQTNCILNPSFQPILESNFMSMLNENAYKGVNLKEANTTIRENSTAHPLSHDFDNSAGKELPFNEKIDEFLQFQTNYTSESDKNTSSFRSGTEMEVKGYNILNISREDDIRNYFEKLVESTDNESSNNDIFTENGIRRTSELPLLQWYAIINISLSWLALIAIAATLESQNIYLQDTNSNTSNIKLVKTGSTESSTPTSGLNSFAAPAEKWNESFYDREPEDLSIRSTISLVSTSTQSLSQSPAKIIASNSSTQRDAIILAGL